MSAPLRTAAGDELGEPTTPLRHGLQVLHDQLRGTSAGMVALALVVGLGGGLGAVAFRYLVYGATWIVTGQEQYGVQGVASSHVPYIGRWFVLVAPVVGGLIIGPLIQRFAREARGHGVPEVMAAVAENGGRIRPQVTVVKAFASAICIGTGGSVGREGPIVQIGSALASSLGQLVRLTETRLRLLVACGAAAGISATFNAPLTGVLFGLELILGTVSAEAIAVILVASMVADAVSRAFFGSAPFFGGLNLGTGGHSLTDYVLFGVLGLLGGLVGVLFKTVLYGIEDLCDWAWKGRPEWLRPAVGGLLLGLILLLLPQMYGVGYPVIRESLDGNYVVWFLLLLVVGKMVASGLTIGIGGSGGVFAPSLFVGATFGMAYGAVAHHLFGGAVSPEAAYGLVAMAAVFAGATRAPLTASASVLEMSGDFGIVLPVMLGTALASAISARVSRGTIYTTKLLRRGLDIERPKTGALLQLLTVADAMVPLREARHRLAPLRQQVATLAPQQGDEGGESAEPDGAAFLRDTDTVEDALQLLVAQGYHGLPVVGADGHTTVGWVTNRDVLRTLAQRLGQTVAESEDSARAFDDGLEAGSVTPNDDYRLLDLTVPAEDVKERRVGDIHWPPATLVVNVHAAGTDVVPNGDTVLHRGDRLTLLVPKERTGDARSALEAEAPAVP